MNVMHCHIDVVIELFSAPLPNLQDLDISVYSGSDLKRFSDLNAPWKLLENVARNTGALDRIRIAVDGKARMDTKMLNHLRNICEANGKLRILDLRLSGAKISDGSLGPLKKCFSNNALESEESFWSSLPDRIQASLSIPISHLRVNARTLMQHFIDEVLLIQIGKPQEVLTKMWKAVYPSPSYKSAAGLSTSCMDGLCDKQDNTGEIVQWVVDTAIMLFDSIDSIDLEVVPAGRCLRDLLDVIYLVVGFDSLKIRGVDNLSEHVFRLARILQPESPLSALAEESVYSISFYHERIADEALSRLLAAPAALQLPIKRFQDSGIPVWRMFAYTPKTLLTMIQEIFLVHVNENNDDLQCLFLYLGDQIIAKLQQSKPLDQVASRTTKAYRFKVIQFVLDQMRRYFPNDTRPTLAVRSVLRSLRVQENDLLALEWYSQLLTAADLLDDEVLDCIAMFDQADHVIQRVWNRFIPSSSLEHLLSLAILRKHIKARKLNLQATRPE